MEPALKQIADPLVDQNPVAVHILGICSALAVTTSMTKALTMSVALTVVPVLAAGIISAIRAHVPSQIRIIAQLTIIGASLFMVERDYTLAESAVYGLGTGIGWALAITAFAATRARLCYADIPRGLKGLGAAFIVAGIMSMGFSAFVGVGLP